MSTGIGRVGKLAAAVMVVFAFAWVAHATQAAGTKDAQTTGTITGKQEARGTKSPNGAPDLSALDARIKQLKTEFHSQLDPLQQQIRTLKDRYEPQISDLEKQRKTLSEERKPAAIQELDKQEDADLEALASREKDELDKVRARYQVERKSIEQKYADERKEVLAHK